MTLNGPESHPSHEEQIKERYLKQKRMLEQFLERGAISRAQYDKSLRDMKEKMEISEQDAPDGTKET